MKKYLTSHLDEANESYFQHLKFSTFMGFKIISSAVVIIIHGFLPFAFTKYTSKRIEEIYLIFRSRIGKQRVSEIEQSWDI